MSPSRRWRWATSTRAPTSTASAACCSRCWRVSLPSRACRSAGCTTGGAGGEQIAPGSPHRRRAGREARDLPGRSPPLSGEDGSGRHAAPIGRRPQRRRKLGLWGTGRRGSGASAREIACFTPRTAPGVGFLERFVRLQRRPVVHPALRHARDGRLTRQHLEQHAAEAVDVGARVEVAQRHRLLGAHVPRRADRLSGLGEREAAGGADGARDPEIRHDRVRAGEQDVLGFDVAVDDPLSVAKARASATSRAMWSASSSGSLRSRSKRCRNDSPSTYGMT